MTSIKFHERGYFVLRQDRNGLRRSKFRGVIDSRVYEHDCDSQKARVEIGHSVAIHGPLPSETSREMSSRRSSINRNSRIDANFPRISQEMFRILEGF